MLRGPTTTRSGLTGDVVQVDLVSLYRNPPADLKALYPTRFDTSPDRLILKSKNGESLEYRNYSRGMGTEWKNEAWSTLLPEAKNSKQPDFVPNALRTLRQSWGGDLVALPMTHFLR
jgi:hypothetical protein